MGAHPDDADFATAATSALWAKQGKKIVWVVMTDGAEGSEVPSLVDTDLMLTREQEQRAACEVYGVQAVEFLRFSDGHLTNSEAARKGIVRLIRKYRPRVVFTHDPIAAHLWPQIPMRNLMRPDISIIPIIAQRATSCWMPSSPPSAIRVPIANCWPRGFHPYRVHELLSVRQRPQKYVCRCERND